MLSLIDFENVYKTAKGVSYIAELGGRRDETVLSEVELFINFD